MAIGLGMDGSTRGRADGRQRTVRTIACSVPSRHNLSERSYCRTAAAAKPKSRSKLKRGGGYSSATKVMKKDGELWRFTKLRQRKHLNNIVEQDHRRIKRLIRPGLGFKGFHTARRTNAGYEIMDMVRKDRALPFLSTTCPPRHPSLAACSELPPEGAQPGASITRRELFPACAVADR
ncbi:DDE-type integrase/transposase/recombinase [Azospirillum brasilense]|uniref:DDE-type integrase/transposase/recombinase n=1 Tax=Azospirillum brasilense TaxID=192 RepID=UPI003D7D4BD7